MAQSFLYYFSPDFSEELYVGRVFYGEKPDSYGRRGVRLTNAKTPEELGRKMCIAVMGITEKENGHDEQWQRHHESMGLHPRPLNADEEKRFLKELRL